MSEQCQWERGCFFSSPSNMHWIGGYDSSRCLQLAVIVEHFEQRNSSLALLGVGCCRRLQQNVERASNSACKFVLPPQYEKETDINSTEIV